MAEAKRKAKKRATSENTPLDLFFLIQFILSEKRRDSAQKARENKRDTGGAPVGHPRARERPERGPAREQKRGGRGLEVEAYGKFRSDTAQLCRNLLWNLPEFDRAWRARRAKNINNSVSGRRKSVGTRSDLSDDLSYRRRSANCRFLVLHKVLCDNKKGEGND